MLRNGGELAYNNLTKEWEHPERISQEKDIEHGWSNHGFTICRDNDFHVVSGGKLEDLRNRTVDQQAIPCIIPITGTSELNSTMWLDLQKKLRDEEIELLIEDIEFQQRLEDEVGFFGMTSEEKAIVKLPYVQTELLIHEAVNLSQTWNSGMVKLVEPRSGFKDRIVALSYGNYIATLIENKLDKDSQQSDFDASAWKFLSNL